MLQEVIAFNSAKTFPNLVEAIEYAFNTHYGPIINVYDNNKWRMDKYYKEYVDNFLKAYLPILDAIYKSNGTKEPGKE
jgi:hypothetical protein